MRHAMRVRIAYVAHWRGGAQTGPFHKVASQLATWRRLGETVGLFVTTSPESAPDWKALPADHVRVHAGPARLIQRMRLMREVLHWNPDIIYERHGLFYPTRQHVARRLPIVVEINGDDIAEWRQLSRTKYVYNRVTRAATLRRSAGFVFVTRELQSAPPFRRYSSWPHRIIGNGIELSAIPSQPDTERRPTPRLVFVGHPHTPWHGVDHLRALAETRPQWHFLVIGCDTSDLGGKAPSNVTLCPELRRDELFPLLATADVGIGPLALYRKSMSESSSLKVREYLASGLPVVYGGEDTDIPADAPYALSIPNRADAATRATPALDDFVSRWQGRRVSRAAISHLDVSIKEKERLALMYQVLSARSSSSIRDGKVP